MTNIRICSQNKVALERAKELLGHLGDVTLCNIECKNLYFAGPKGEKADEIIKLLTEWLPQYKLEVKECTWNNFGIDIPIKEGETVPSIEEKEPFPLWWKE
jgi:hypothetical protein